jgi:hypothetical protein
VLRGRCFINPILKKITGEDFLCFPITYRFSQKVGGLDCPASLSPQWNNPFSANFPSPESDDELMFSLVQFDLLPIPAPKCRRAQPLTILPRIRSRSFGSASQSPEFAHGQLPNREDRPQLCSMLRRSGVWLRHPIELATMEQSRTANKRLLCSSFDQ